MKISKKRTVQVMVFAIALLLVLALSIGITGAWYQAKRQASGTVIMDQGIIIDYKGFAQDAAATTWGKGVTLNLFAITDAQPGENIAVNAASIKANVDSVDFYARVKLEYKFYNVVKSTEEGVADTETEVTTLANPSDLITTSENFFGDSWVKSQNNDGWYYYGADTTLGKLTPSVEESAFVALFADGAKFIIEGANFVGAENGGEGGGFKIDDTTSINKIVVTLTLETLQGSADAANEGWSISRLPVVENFSSKNLTDESGNVLTPSETTLTEGTTYQVVNGKNNGYKFTITNSASGQAQTLASVDVSVVNGEATITGCTGTPTKIVIPDYITVNGKNYKVTSIGDRAFDGCSSLKSITISDSVTIIGYWAFNSCSGLTSITIPDNVTSIGEGAFIRCSGLTSVTISASVTSIGKNPFASCSGLESIAVAEGNTKYKSIDNCLIEIESKTLIDGCKNSIIPNDGSVTSIGNNAFYGCSGLTSITIPDSVTQLNQWAFSYCTGLKSVKIGSELKKIGGFSFTESTALTEVIIDSKTFAEVSTGMASSKIGINHLFKYNNVKKVYVKSGLTVGSYITNSFTETTSDKIGYVLYTK